MDQRCQKPGGVKTETTRVGATRVRYRERQVLRASDLVTEQSYLVAARRRHNIGHHGWGIVGGLDLAITPDGLIVEPGMAVDGYGRELFVHAPLALPPDAFETLHSATLDVWLFYDIAEATVPLRGNWDCGPGRNTRTREQSRLRLTVAREIDPRRPIEVPYEDLEFPPHETLPDSPAREWPVYLGTIRRTATAPPAYEIPPASLPYATLTGESVAAPSGRARMQVGSELENDTRRFAVSVADANGKFVERLAVDRDANTVVTGNTTIGNRPGDDAPARCLRMRENKPVGTSDTIIKEPLCRQSTDSDAKERPGAARMIHFLPLAATPAAAAPWQIYRTSVKQDDRTLQQLRVELKHPGDEGDPKLYRLAIGRRDANGDFKACFTVSADCTVTIEGGINVNGQLIEGAIQADPSDPRFTAELTQQWATGVIAAESQLGVLFGDINSGDLGVTITNLRSQRGSGTPVPISGISTMPPDEVLLYDFTVRNNGQSRITNIQIYANLFFNGTRQSQEKLPLIPFNLDPGQNRVILPGSVFDPRGAEGNVEIVVTAIGVGSLPNVLAGNDSATINVRIPPVIP